MATEHPKAVLTVNGQEYTLQFTRDSIRMLETLNAAPTNEGRDGMPMSLATTMFYGALRMHHKNINQTQSQALFDELLEAGLPFEELTVLLFDLYNAVFNPPVPLEDGEKKVTVQRFGITAEDEKKSK